MKVRIKMIGWQAVYAAGREFERRKQWTVAASIYKKALAAGYRSNSYINYRLGHAYFQANEIDQAIEYTEKALNLDPNNASWQYKLGFYYERQKRFNDALLRYNNALALNPENASWVYRKYSCFAALGDRISAQESIRTALALDPGNTKYTKILAQVLRKSSARWQELDILKSNQHLFQNDLDWHLKLAQSYGFLSQHKDAALQYSIINKLEPKNSIHYYNEGYHWELAGNNAQSEKCYSLAIESDMKYRSTIHGIGAFHQAMDRWQLAAKAYEKTTGGPNPDAETWYRYGFCLDRTSDWSSAADAYQTAVSMDPSKPYWTYKIGFALERSLRWREAAAAYLTAALQPEGKQYWFYRAGYCLTEAGYDEEACLAFAQDKPTDLSNFFGSAPNDKFVKLLSTHERTILSKILEEPDPIRDSGRLEALGQKAVMAGDWENAIQLYSKAIRHSDNQSPRLYYQLGHALAQMRDFRSASQAYKSSRAFMTPDGINLTKFLKNPSLKKSMLFVESMETNPVEENLVLWESNHGSSIGCHPLAIFRELIRNPRYAKLQHVWVTNYPESIPADLLGMDNVSFTKTHSETYINTLAKAKYLVNNVSFPPYYIRREGQYYLNTWHGTPFKTLGKDMKGPILQHANLARNFLQSTHIMSPNEHTSWALTERHDISGIYTGKIQVTGSPRLDRMINNRTELHQGIRRELGLADSDTRPVVLYAPTWRGSTNDRTLNIDALMADIKSLHGVDHHLVFRAHRLTEKLLAGIDIPTITVPKHIDTSDLLAAVDVLVTDYSSISFDFLPMNKPIIYFTPDYDDYILDRGLYLEPEEMPGTFCYDHSELAEKLREVILEQANDSLDYSDSRSRFSPREDGLASQRVIDFYFENKPEEDLPFENHDNKKNILFHQSLIPNGIATSFLNLVKSLDSDQYRIVLVVEPDIIEADPGRLEIFHRLPANVQVIARVGVYAQRPREKYLMQQMTKNYSLSNTAQYEIYFNGFAREFRRIFGPKKFDAQVEFDGYSPTWCSLMSTGSSQATKLVYLHNDMVQEWRMKYPDLEAVFGLYHRFDHCVSVAREVSEINSSAISELFAVDAGRFVHANNQIDNAQVIAQSLIPLEADIYDWFASGNFNFLSIGRMSPEKDHQKLIRAFARFHTNNPKARLAIIGDGPLRADLEELIDTLGAREYIWLAGQRPNPYSALRNADAFVLPSLHEGQPMVLFEAMILGKHILCTDMPGPSGMLANNHGLIVENSIDGLVFGLTQIEEQKDPHQIFNASEYQQSARNEFLNLALGNESVIPDSELDQNSDAIGLDS